MAKFFGCFHFEVFFCYFQGVAKLHDFLLFSWCWKYFMIFGLNVIGKISRLFSMKLVKIFSYTCKIGKISWILDIFTKLAKISDFCLFSWCWQNFRFYGSFYEIVKISWFVAQFHVCKQNSMFFLLFLWSFFVVWISQFVAQFIFTYCYELNNIL